jgi:hypothetical protein
MCAYNVFLNNVRKYDVRRNAKSIIKDCTKKNELKSKTNNLYLCQTSRIGRENP